MRPEVPQPVPAPSAVGPFVAALDGGGTKTAVAVSTLDGHVLGLAVAGPSNAAFTPPARAQAQVRSALLRALEAAGAEAQAVVAVVACAAGPGRLETVLAPMLPAARIEVLPEYVVCLASAYERERGAVVLSGTGAVEWAMGPFGGTRIDGLGALLGDDGSAFWLAQAGFRAAGRALDGLGPKTVLGASMEPVARALYRQGRALERDRVAAAAILVTQAALAGDAVAAAICRLAAARLARGLERAMRSAGLLDTAATIALCGGLLRETPVVREPLVRRIGTFAPRARAVLPTLDPVRGGLLLALAGQGRAWDDALRHRLEASMRLPFPSSVCAAARADPDRRCPCA